MTLRHLLSLGSLLGGLLLWELISQFGLLNQAFFPPPSALFLHLWGQIRSGVITSNLQISLYRIFAGFFLGAIPGLLLGLLMGYYPTLEAILEPWVSATYPLPKVALIPLLLIILGFGELFRFTIIAIGVFYIMLINTRAGVQSVDLVLVEAARNYGARDKDVLLEVILPSTYPFIFAGIRLALGMALILVVVAEFIAGNRGLGFLVWSAGEMMKVKDVYTTLIVLGLLGFIFTSLVKFIQRRITPWQRELSGSI